MGRVAEVFGGLDFQIALLEAACQVRELPAVTGERRFFGPGWCDQLGGSRVGRRRVARCGHQRRRRPRLPASSIAHGDGLPWPEDARVVGGGGRVCGYDPDGRRTQVTAGGVGVAAYGWDQRGLLASVQDGGPAAVVGARSYDGDGRLVGYSADGTSMDLMWDPTGAVPQIADVRVGAAGEIILSQAAQRIAFGFYWDGELGGGGLYTYDAAGSSITNETFPAPSDYGAFGEPVDLPTGNPIQPAYRAEMTIFYATCGIGQGADYVVAPMPSQPATTFRC